MHFFRTNRTYRLGIGNPVMVDRFVSLNIEKIVSIEHALTYRGTDLWRVIMGADHVEYILDNDELEKLENLIVRI